MASFGASQDARYPGKAGLDYSTVKAAMHDRKQGFATKCLIAIGANLPGRDGATPREVCERALVAVCALAAPQASVGQPWQPPIRSRWFSTAPVPPSDQPRYVNGIVRLWCAATPAVLLAELQAIEMAEGRVRGEANAPRTLDLDVIDQTGLVRAAPDPILPHPRAHLRAFVLLPLRDVAPDWVHPVLGLGIDALIAALPPQDIRPL